MLIEQLQVMVDVVIARVVGVDRKSRRVERVKIVAIDHLLVAQLDLRPERQLRDEVGSLVLLDEDVIFAEGSAGVGVWPWTGPMVSTAEPVSDGTGAIGAAAEPGTEMSVEFTGTARTRLPGPKPTASARSAQKIFFGRRMGWASAMFFKARKSYPPWISFCRAGTV